MCHLTPFALGFSHVISDTNVIEKEIPGDVVQEQENLHMEEVGVMDGSNKRRNFIQETWVCVPCEPESKRWPIFIYVRELTYVMVLTYITYVTSVTSHMWRNLTQP